MNPNNDLNLIDTIDIFKKNIKTFYLIIVIGFFTAIIGVSANLVLNKAKTNVTTKFFIINAFENTEVLNLLTLDVSEVSSDIPEMRGIVEKIEAYESITNEYVKFVHFHTERLKDATLNEDNYEIFIIKSASPAISLEMINIKDLKAAKEDTKRFLSALNNIVTPLVINNYKSENKFLKDLLTNEKYLGVTSQNFMQKQKSNEKLNILYNTRLDIINNLGNDQLKIFESSSTTLKTELSNIKIFVATMVVFCIFFLLLVIIRK